MHHEKGFTLVELAIVMTIIGLLIGGILKGQELLDNARVTATVAQVKSYEAATSAFRDIYGGQPGDLANAGNCIPGCSANCTTAESDGHVGSWGGVTLFMIESGQEAMTVPPSSGWDEGYLFWVHLLKANLISGVTDEALNGHQAEAGVTHPSAKTGGVFNAGSQQGASSTKWGAPVVIDAITDMGLVVVLMTGLSTDMDPTAAPGNAPLLPSRAAQIDRKMDDGSPVSGTVLGLGVTDSCFKLDNGRYIYDESLSSRDCGLFFRIQG